MIFKIFGPFGAGTSMVLSAARPSRASDLRACGGGLLGLDKSGDLDDGYESELGTRNGGHQTSVGIYEFWTGLNLHVLVASPASVGSTLSAAIVLALRAISSCKCRRWSMRRRTLKCV